MNLNLYTLFICILGIIIQACCGAEFAYTIEVDAGKHSCFFQTVNNTRYKFMEIDYQVSYFLLLLFIYLNF